jgi:thiamine biosynthesis lipoprotein
MRKPGWAAVRNPGCSRGTACRHPAEPARAEAETARLQAAIDAAFDQIELVHRLMSYHDPDSDLSRLNRDAPNRAQQVDPHTYEVLRAALRFARLSAGAFDPCVAESLEQWGYLPVVTGTSHNRSAERCRSRRAGWEDIQLLDDHRVRFKRPVRLDLGGIAKGYAVDLATQAMQRANVHEIVVNAGGDMRVAGNRTDRVCLRHPDAPTASVEVLQLRNAALASSGAYFSRRLSGSRQVSALLDPRTREPHLANDGISIRAADCMTADALTKVVLFAPRTIAERVLDECGAEAFVLQRAT